jgi:hypothetical protein
MPSVAPRSTILDTLHSKHSSHDYEFIKRYSFVVGYKQAYKRHDVYGCRFSWAAAMV